MTPDREILYAIRLLNQAMSIAWTTASRAAGDDDAAFGRALRAGNQEAWNLFGPAAIAAVRAAGRTLPTDPHAAWIEAESGLESDVAWLAKLAHSYGR